MALLTSPLQHDLEELVPRAGVAHLVGHAGQLGVHGHEGVLRVPRQVNNLHLLFCHLARQVAEEQVGKEDARLSGGWPEGFWDILQHIRGEGVGGVLRGVLNQHPDNLLMPVIAYNRQARE